MLYVIEILWTMMDFFSAKHLSCISWPSEVSPWSCRRHRITSATTRSTALPRTCWLQTSICSWSWAGIRCLTWATGLKERDFDGYWYTNSNSNNNSTIHIIHIIHIIHYTITIDVKKNYSVSPFLNGLMEGSVLHRFRFLLSWLGLLMVKEKLMR